MANAIETALDEHYYRTLAEPSEIESLMRKDWWREGAPVADVVSECAKVDKAAAEDIRIVLADRHFDRERAEMGEENPFEKTAYYDEKGVDDINNYREGWQVLEESLRTEGRYFNRTAESILAETFAGITEYKTHGGRPVIIKAGPGMELATFYRARVFQSNEKLARSLERPDKEIGPPPPSAAASGRMNAHGIGVFYGATDPLIALAEVRPPVGSKVVVGRFELLRPLQLLDLEALQSVNIEGGVFDRDYLHRKERATVRSERRSLDG